MKKAFVFVVAALLAAPAFAQKPAVPAAVTAQFAKTYPKAQKLKWKKEDATFEAEFRLGSAEMSAVFDPAGKQLEAEKEISVSQLPAAVQTAMKGRRIKEAAEITNASGALFYEAEAGGKDYLFNASGQPVKKVN